MALNAGGEPVLIGYKEWLLLREMRDGLFNWLVRKLPDTPEYVIQDLVYKNIKNKNQSAQEVQEWLDNWFVNLKWEYKKDLPITMEIFSQKTQNKLKERIGGNIQKDVTGDAERHQTQQDLIRNKGVSQEPIIILKTKDGRYELAEGWHRTIQAFKIHPDGFIQPNVYIGLNAKWVN